MYLPKKTYWYDQYGYTTVKEHMPESHLAYEHNRAQNAATLIERAQRVGPFTRWAVENILQRTSFPQQAYRRCNGVLLLRTYTPVRDEISFKKFGNLNYFSYLCR